MTRTKQNKTKKLPDFRIGITAKIWLAIMAIVLLVIAAIWLFQVVFLEDYYIGIKQDDFKATMLDIVAELNENGVSDSEDGIIEIVRESTLCVDISEADGFGICYYDSLGYSCPLHGPSKSENTDILNKMRLAESGTAAVYRISNKQYFLGSIKTSIALNNTEIDVTVVAAQPLAPVREAALVVKNQLMWISIFLFVVATVIAFLISRSLTKPIKKITQGTAELASGKQNVQVEVSGDDEISDLANSFNYMSNELTKVNKLQKELVANISHDIRTPLTMIRGYAEAIKDITGDDKSVREQQLDIIMEESNRLSTLVNDVMDLSLLQAGQKKINPAVFDISKKAADILSRYQLLENDGYTFKLETDKDILVTADEIRIEQVIYNLLNNAINHVGDIKEITLRVTSQGEYALVEVADRGTGIAKEDLPLIWDRYYKPYKKGVRKEQGTGLGLSIVKANLIAHGADFGVESTLGVGSTFWFRLKKC